MYNGIILRLKDVRPHSNADRLKLATCEGNQVIVGIEAKEGDLGIYFPTDGQLSEEFCKVNDLIRRKNPDGTPAGGMFDENRRVRTQKFRGEVSDGFWIPVNSIHYALEDFNPFPLAEGTEFSNINGHQICNKYISPKTKQHLANISVKKSKKVKSEMFKEHYDTPQLGRNIDKIEKGSRFIFTEKLHGTSQRVGHVLVNKQASLWSRICLFLSSGKWTDGIYQEWEYLVGTRRVVLDNTYNKNTGFHSDSLREQAAKPFIGKLRKGETVYYEVVGYDCNGGLIMPSVDIRKLGDKEFQKKYSSLISDYNMSYKYNCKPGEFDIYVYRITLTDEDNNTIDLPWEQVKKICECIGVKHVPEIETVDVFVEVKEKELAKLEGFNGSEMHKNFLMAKAEFLSKGDSMLDPSHIREGVCLIAEKGLDIKVFKHKSFEFKVLEGIVKDTGVMDLEEAS